MNKKGFTFIEILIYIAIIGLVVASFVTFSFDVSKSRNKIYSVQEVQSNARVALETINQKIRASSGVNTGTSVFGSDPGVLSLVMSDAAKNPTIISLDADNGTLQITEGVGSPVSITSSEVKITNLVFTNLTNGVRENIKINLTVAFQEQADTEFAYSQSLETAASVRF